MVLKIRRGAVVGFTLTHPKNTTVCGRVDFIDADEVVIFPQEYVAKEETTRGTGHINTTITVDTGEEIHINKDLIAMWTYATMGKEGMYTNLVNPSEIPFRVVSHYDSDGFCRGSGEFFGF